MFSKKIVVRGLAFLTSIVLLIVFMSFSAMATIYYVSSSIGNDAWEGTTPEPIPAENPTNGPWKSIYRVNGQTFEPGDTIKFKRGDTWITCYWGDGVLTPPTSGTADNRITFTNYGTGDLPLFRGAVQIVSSNYRWTKSNSGKNEYYCEAAGGGFPWLYSVRVVEADNEGLLWKDEPGSLADHEWGWGDNDALGFNTVYVRDKSGAPGSENGFQSVLASQSSCIVINDKSYIDIDGIETRNGSFGIRIINDAQQNRIMNCVCTHNHDGIDAWADQEDYGGNNEVYNCNCSYNYRHGIMSSNQGKGFSLIHYNLCEYNNQFGIWIAQANGSCIIEHNECRYNSQDIKDMRWGYWGIEVVQNSSSDYHIVRYNKCHHNTRPDLKFRDGGGINIRADNAKVYYNLCYLNDGPGIGGGHMEETPHHDAKVYHNVCYHNCQNYYFYSIWNCAEFFLHGDIYNYTFSNNIVEKDPEVDYYIVYIQNDNGMNLDYNCYYSPDGEYMFSLDGWSYSFDKWQSYPRYNDSNSFCSDPQFVDAENGDFHIRYG